MGRIGRSYPRFPPAGAQRPVPTGRRHRPSRVSGAQLAGALVGLAAALGLIGFLLGR